LGVRASIADAIRVHVRRLSSLKLNDKISTAAMRAPGPQQQKMHR
jgi:hypothetical protein